MDFLNRKEVTFMHDINKDAGDHKMRSRKAIGEKKIETFKKVGLISHVK